MTTLNDLASLPTPAVIEPLSFETIFIELQSEFQSRYPDYSALLASDPAVKLLEVAAYREVLLRNRINTAAKASSGLCRRQRSRPPGGFLRRDTLDG